MKEKCFEENFLFFFLIQKTFSTSFFFHNQKGNINKKGERNIKKTKFRELPMYFENLSRKDKRKQIDAMKKITNREWRIYKKVAEKEPSITEDVKEVVKKNRMKLQGLESRLKTPVSLYEKMRKRGTFADITEMKDIVRYTGVSSCEKLTKSVISILSDFKRMGYRILEIKNTWLDKNAVYKGIGVFLISPIGQIFEIQFHTEESYQVKNETHSLYETRRTIPDNDPLAIEIDNVMRKLSSELKAPKGIERIRNK